MISDILHSTLDRWLVKASVRGGLVPNEVKFHKEQPAVGIQIASNREFDRHSFDWFSPSFHDAISYTPANTNRR
jgi:hypothetical protein